nr:MAG TPA: Protein of unknown function (DUF3800) [Caudoviricetes sp.]
MVKQIYNIFCDESCHLENDNSDVMILGAITCLEKNKKKHYEAIRNLKLKHGMSSWNELKWVKVSSSKIDFYEELIEYFLINDDITFRVCVAPKRQLDHVAYKQTHDTWYYKMYFNLLDKMIQDGRYSIFIDIKDTKGGKKISKLTEVLVNAHYDFCRDKIEGIYQIRSHESELIQLADLFIGAIGYYHRGLYDNVDKINGKSKLVNLIQTKVGIDFSKATSVRERKFNIFIWQPSWRSL